ncbi:MAG: VCBS repeat-containing protein, partial [Acidobacteria bacterium]|nr:VCBS repeat-containing protein [Acidobacteriota bacterium]
MTGWKLAGIADMDKNGKPDMIWQNTGSRRLRYWLMGGARGETILASVDAQGPDRPGWTVRTAVDMDANGHADMAWQADSDHQVLVAFMGGPDGTQFLSSSWMSTGAMEEWSVAALADMDANGKFDMIWQHDATRILACWFLQGPKGDTFLDFAWLSTGAMEDWSVAALVDLDTDGKADLVWQNDQTRNLAVWYLQGAKGATFKAFAWLNQTPMSGWRAHIGR